MGPTQQYGSFRVLKSSQPELRLNSFGLSRMIQTKGLHKLFLIANWRNENIKL